MAETLDRLTPTALVEVASAFQAIVFDQWGVLHNGSAPYPGAAEAIEALAAGGKTLAVLSNSGKRAEPNAQRIAAMGLPAQHFGHVMTSGEAFWQDCAAGKVTTGQLLPFTAKAGDFEAWRGDLDVRQAAWIGEAAAVLLMGLPEGTDGTAQRTLLKEALASSLPLYCTNPDRGSPRADGAIQLSPGALAHEYEDAGGKVTFYGKPHRPVFDALTEVLGIEPSDILMVGDSLEHDIAGGAAAGWKTAFVMGGLHADAFIGRDVNTALVALTREHASPRPDYLISRLAETGA